MATETDLDALRARIRELDRGLIDLAAERVAVARQVGEAKRRADQPIVDYAQERVVLERTRVAAQEAGLDARVAEAILVTLIRAAVSAQDQDSWRHASVGLGKTAVVMGGEGRIFGTLIGAFIIAVIRNGMNLMGVHSDSQEIVLGAVLLLAVLLDHIKRTKMAGV